MLRVEQAIERAVPPIWRAIRAKQDEPRQSNVRRGVDGAARVRRDRLANVLARVLRVERADSFGGFEASCIQREFFRDSGDFAAHALFDGGVAQVSEYFGDPSGDLFHFRLAHAARGDGGAAYADAAGFHRRQGIEGDRVLVDGHAGAFEREFGVTPGDSARVHVHEHEVIIGAASNDTESALGETGGESFGIRHHLALVVHEFRLGCFLQADCFRGDDVLERAALKSRKRDAVEIFRQISRGKGPSRRAGRAESCA